MTNLSKMTRLPDGYKLILNQTYLIVSLKLEFSVRIKLGFKTIV